MKQVRKRQRFGNWQVIDSNPERDRNYNKYVLCYDEVVNELAYVRVEYLLNGKTKGHRTNPNRYRNNGGHSTRFLNNELPKYVYTYNNPKSRKHFRVAIKTKESGYKTLGYFYTVCEAEVFIKHNKDFFMNLEG